MNFTGQVKAAALGNGADLVGFGPISRFDGLPPELNPKGIMPQARTVITVGLVFYRGSLKTVEEGTYWISYNFDSNYYLNDIEGPRVLRMTARCLEQNGYTALPLDNLMLGGARAARKTRPEHPAPADMQVPYDILAVGCGLGEIGRGGRLLTPEYGPRQRVYCLLTDAELEATPLFKGGICDGCGDCIAGCRACAIGEEVRVVLEADGLQYRAPYFDEKKCEYERMGRDARHSPFISGEEKISELPPPFYKYLRKNALYADFCCGRGCVTSCLDHLEKAGRIGSSFKLPLISQERW